MNNPVHLIHRLTQADISSTTMAHLFFFHCLMLHSKTHKNSVWPPKTKMVRVVWSMHIWWSKMRCGPPMAAVSSVIRVQRPAAMSYM